MLAQNLKTAADLKLNDKQYEALIKTLALLETNGISFIHEDERADVPVKDKKHYRYFNMNVWDAAVMKQTAWHKCGTVMCIGGTAEWLANDNGLFNNTNNSLYDLFYPNVIQDWDNITVEKAAQALRNYLTTGEANWEQVMSS